MPNNKEEEIIKLHPDQIPEQDFNELIKQENVLSYPILIGSTIRGGKILMGSGDKCFKFEPDKGLWLGNATFASAPFRVDMAGNLTATSATITGAITISSGSGIANLSDTGGLAVKDNVGATDCDTTIIDGGKIITGLLTADNIQAGIMTGRTIRTDVAGEPRISIRQTGEELNPNEIVFYDTSDNILSRIARQTWVSGSSLDIMSYDEIRMWVDGGGALDIEAGGVSISPGLSVTGNIIVSGTVDGVNISVHAGNASAHHTKTTSLAHSAITGITASQHHSSTSNGIAITPSGVNASGNIIASGILQGGSGSNITGILYVGSITLGAGGGYDILPYASNYGSIGYQTRHWDKIYANTYYSDYNEYLSFQKHNDIDLIKAIKIKTIKGKEVWNLGNLPEEIFSENKKMVKIEAINGFLIGTIKQLIEKVEKLENK